MRRREFLRTGAALPFLASAKDGAGRAKSCILLMLTGGPSQLDTWDPKPEAPSSVRSPFRAIETNVPGIRISELFPRMARLADRYTLIRGVHHEAAAVHGTGHQLMQTGRLSYGDAEYPHIGSVISKLTGVRPVVLPWAVGNLGDTMPCAQSAGFLGAEHEACVVRPEQASFSKSCAMAARLTEAGTRFVTVNMFRTVFDEVTWDSHGSKPFSTMDSYRDVVGPAFDRGYSSLIVALERRGLLDSTLVVGMGEFGRTPRINPAGGRDHWPGCWTIHMAGGGIRGGEVHGSSDAAGSEPRDKPVTPAMVVATIYRAMGVPLATELTGPDGRRIHVVEPGTRAIDELFI